MEETKDTYVRDRTVLHLTVIILNPGAGTSFHKSLNHAAADDDGGSKKKVQECALNSHSGNWGPVVDSWEHNSKPAHSTRGREFLDYLFNYWLLMEGSAANS